MRIDLLEHFLRRYRPKLIYTIPNFHNPTGAEMELDRRRQLVELAGKYRVLIIEDDAYADICFEGHSLPNLKSMDNHGYVIYLSTFSKNIYPGLRLGWMVADKKVIKKYASAKQIMDLHSSSLSQWMVERFIINGGLYRHIPIVCREYREKRDAMYNALVKFAPGNCIWNHPRGGYYIWLKLPQGITASRLVAKAAEHKVFFVPGTVFFTADLGDDYIRLNFTYTDLKQIPIGVHRLCVAIQELQNHHDDFAADSLMEINPIV